MKTWLFIIFALVVQETVSLNAVIFEIHQMHFHVWLINGLFVVATIIDIVVGYAIGRHMHKHMTHGKIFAFAEKWSARFHASISGKTRWLALFILGNFSFPYLNGFIAAWLGIPFAESFILLFIGNVFWYGILWLIVLGVVSVVPDPTLALGIIFAITLGVMLLLRKFRLRKI